MTYHEVANAAAKAILATLQAGHGKYPHDPWKTRPDSEDADHAIAHLMAYCESNNEEPHLSHALTRLAFILARQLKRKTRTMNNTMQNPVLLIDSREAAKALGISARKLWGLTDTGDIPHVKIGRLVRYRPEALKEWIESQEKRGRLNEKD